MKNKHIKEFVIFIVIFIVIASAILIRNLNDLDELWNYSFAKNVAEGRIPYRDFNMIQMPLLPIICSIFLKLFANELIVMRILSIFLNSLIVFMVYKILTVLKINKHFRNLILISMYFVYYNYFCIDYNFSVLLIALIGIYLELRFVDINRILLKSNAKHDIVLGILIGMAILLKQTTGLFISMIFIFYKILILSKKSEIKETIKIIALRTIGVCIPILILILYLSINNIWTEFLDYAVYGIKTFSNKISYINLLKNNSIHIRALSILIPIIIIYMYIKTVVNLQKTQEDRNIFILFCYSVGCFIVTFPISDVIHFLIGSMPAMISLTYIIYLKLKKLIKRKMFINFVKDYVKAFSIILIVILVCTAIFLIINYVSNHDSWSKINHYKFIPSDLDNSILDIDSYIKDKNIEGKNVYILDATACLYMIPIDKYNKDYDMFLKGNLGSKGEQGQIEKLQKENNTILLILNEEYSRNWQNPEEVRKYITDNWTKEGEINLFDIYENKIKMYSFN